MVHAGVAFCLTNSERFRTEGLTGRRQNRNGEATRCSKCFENHSGGQSGAYRACLNSRLRQARSTGGFVPRGRALRGWKRKREERGSTTDTSWVRDYFRLEQVG